MDQVVLEETCHLPSDSESSEAFFQAVLVEVGPRVHRGGHIEFFSSNVNLFVSKNAQGTCSLMFLNIYPEPPHGFSYLVRVLLGSYVHPSLAFVKSDF